MKKVSVVILNFKTKDLTLKCVDSVKSSDYKNLQIIVVDNNSQDSLGEAISKLKEIVFIQTEENLGYSGGNNIGIKKALDDGAELVFILNPDTTIEKDTVSKLVNGLEKERAGIAGPKIYFSGTRTIWYAGGIFDKNNVLGSHKGVDEHDDGQYEKIEETDFVTGAAMMVKKEVFEKIGFFDESYFLYYEDNDFCFRAKQSGFKVVFLPQAVVFHDNAKSTGLGSPLQDYYITRNRMLFASKFLSVRTRIALFKESMRNLKISARRKALGDFLLNSLGKGNI